MKILIPNDSEFEIIKKHIVNFELDNRDLKKNEFIVATENSHILGFGRIRKHKSCDEMSTLGVIVSERKKGISKILIQNLINLSSQPLYLVCIIPDLFSPFGFKIVNEFPEEIKDKIIYCTHELVVPEAYVVMKHF